MSKEQEPNTGDKTAKGSDGAGGGEEKSGGKGK